ncbi:Mono-and diacylglycerol lipase [Tolypocladium capitatum]|uniref:Mono-and diacylglycerol lipase n=1 Tax=Tolypocladium capitatum TaxID=45235 RepID=A0A2K3QL72_9HYPO|nr:Mono-and diacylglycerol lipase [Tolypocladium capitatum]
MWRQVSVLLRLVLSTHLLVGAVAGLESDTIQRPIDAPSTAISVRLFADLERLSRIVDISYCIGNTGVRKPFQCVSRCNEFPELSLVTTWSTGLLMSDSCGYIAVDRGGWRQPGVTDDGSVQPSDEDGAIIVAFRGTYSVTNTIVDLSTVPQKYVPYPFPDKGGKEPPERPKHKCANCTVHMGFLESWRSARDVVLPELKALKARHPSYPVRLVGHSLGGAVACLAALELRVSLGWEDVVVTTFGEPRVGNYQLARFIDEIFDLDRDADLESRSYRRVTHSNDPVPLLPLDDWGYRPHAGEIYISKPDLSPSEGDVRTCVGDSDPACSSNTESYLRQTMHRLLHFIRAGTTVQSHMEAMTFPTRFKLWELFIAHRDYFWRLGLCVPGGDPSNRGRHQFAEFEEL